MKFQIYKFKNYLLDLNFLIKFLRYKIFLGKYSKNLRLEILARPKRGRVLVLAPHPDDEIFGCGGILAKHQAKNDKIKIVYLTGDLKRQREARLATQILGVNDLIFLNFKDGKLINGRKETKKIKSIIKKFKPDIIYAPSFFDSHPDHYATAEILGQSLAKSDFNGEIWSYEIWTPVPANRIIRIDDVFELKIKAIKAYQSQLKERGYLRAISGLNSYRAGMFSAGNHAEAYFVCSRELYQKILTFDI